MKTRPRAWVTHIIASALLLAAATASAQDSAPAAAPQINWQHEGLAGIEQASKDAASRDRATLILVGLSGGET